MMPFETTENPEHPGKIIKRTLELKELTQKEFAYLVGRPAKTINQIINGKKAVTAQTACDLELALNIPAIWWLQKQAEYDLAIECQTYSNTLRVLPKKEKKEPLSKTNALKTEILELQAKGKRYWEIAEITGLRSNTIYNALRRWEKENAVT